MRLAVLRGDNGTDAWTAERSGAGGQTLYDGIIADDRIAARCEATLAHKDRAKTPVNALK